MSVVHIWTDGGCSPNPGRGAWACILKSEGWKDKELFGKVKDADGVWCSDSTSNRAELTALIEALKALISVHNNIVLHTDSSYVKLAVKGVKQPTTNHDLLRETQRLIREKTTGVTVVPVKGHSGQVDNERCHQLVQYQLRTLHE